MAGEDSLSLFQRYLKTKGLHVTEARIRVAKAVLDVLGHCTAMDLWARLRSTEGASLPTVYRTLDLLEHCGLIRKINLGGSTAYYEPLLRTRPHEHLLCTRCGRIVEFVSPRIEEELASWSQKYGFSHESHHVQIRGICPECQRASKEDMNGTSRSTAAEST